MKTIQRGKIMSKKQIHEIKELGISDTEEKINEKKDMLLISHYDDNLQKYVSRSISYDDFQVNLRNKLNDIITQLDDKISNINSSMLTQINDLISRVTDLENNSGGTVIGTVALTNAAFPSHTYTFPCDGMVTF